MATIEIKRLIAKASIQAAIDETNKLVKNTELENAGLILAADFTAYKRDTIKGILSEDQRQLKSAQIINRLLDLVNDYEIHVLNDLKATVNGLAAEVSLVPQTEDNKYVIKEVNDVNDALESIKGATKKEDIPPSAIKRLGNLIERLNNPASSERKVITGLKQGVTIMQKIGKSYNSIAQWFGLAQIPVVFL